MKEKYIVFSPQYNYDKDKALKLGEFDKLEDAKNEAKRIGYGCVVVLNDKIISISK